MGGAGDIRVLADYESLVRAAAEYVIHSARQAASERGRFDWFLSGGRTPQGLYRLLAEPPYADLDLWRGVHFFWGDERCVGPDDIRSNFNLARRCLLKPLTILGENIHRMPADREDLEAAAREYELQLPARSDLILLGVGADGHTASLFPGSPALRETSRRVVPAEGPVEPRRRLTITPPVLACARSVLVLVSGADKATAVASALGEAGSIERTPARLVRGATWFLDESCRPT